MGVLELCRKLNRDRQLKRVAPFLELNEETYYGPSFAVELRHPKPGKKYLHIGSESVIHGTFIFEAVTGEISVGNRCFIGSGTKLISRSGISLGNDVLVSWGCTIYDHDGHSVEWEKRKNDILQVYNDICSCGDAGRNKNWDVVETSPIIIEDKAWIGFGVSILKGVHIGEGAVVAANSVVTGDVEPWTVVGGTPARKLYSLKSVK